MKKLSSFIVLLFSLHSVFSQSNIDVTGYKFVIELNDNNDSIKGYAGINMIAKEDLTTFSLDLAGINKNGKGMIVTDVHFIPKTYAEGMQPVLADFKQENDKIIITCKTPESKGNAISVGVTYKGIPSDGLIISKNKYGHRTFFADNWPNRGHNWLPCADDPADKATVEFAVIAPQHYQVVANGIQIEETNINDSQKLTRWREDVPISTKVMVIGVADFAVNLSGFIDGCIPVYSWVYPEEKDNGFYDYGQAVDILPFYTRNVGPYGYKKLANVQSKTTFGGLENANTIFYHENSINGKRRSEGLLAHEIAHQWFGNMATEKTFAHLWLSEGFATYMTICYFENKYGIDTARTMLIKDRDNVIAFSKKNNHPVVDNNPNYMQLLNPNSYEKGGWALHMLRRQLGDSVYWKGIRKYYATYGGKTADTDDLRKIFEMVSGKDLKQFFLQWLFTPGQPKLQVDWKYMVKEKKLSVTVTQLQEAPFVFTLEIAVLTENKKPSVQKIPITQKTQTIMLSLKDKPSGIQLDPNVSLLFEGTVNEVNQ